MQMTLISLTCAALIALGDFASAQQTTGDVEHEFRGGFPTAEASAKCRDEADYQSAVTAYRFWYPTVSIEGVMQGNRSAGAKDAEAFTYVVAGPRQMALTKGPYTRMSTTGTVCPRSGEFYALMFSHSDTQIFQIFWEHANEDISFERKRNLLIMDNASWREGQIHQMRSF